MRCEKAVQKVFEVSIAGRCYEQLNDIKKVLVVRFCSKADGLYDSWRPFPDLFPAIPLEYNFQDSFYLLNYSKI